MSITVILEADPKPGQKTKLLHVLSQYLPETSRYKGFIEISIYSEVNTELVIFLSKWDSIEVYQQYLQWRVDTGIMAILGDLLTVPPVIRYLSKEISDEFELINT
jgi:quinol monooxygenase YgiN